MTPWDDGSTTAHPPISILGWVRLILRGLVLGTLVFGGLAILLLVRLVERPVAGPRRPATPWITQSVCRAAFVVLGMGFRVSGTPMQHAGATVANHSSWLDIFALNASDRLYFVSKHEVANWPGIGWLARATGTVFIKRRTQDAKKHLTQFETRLLAGHKLLFFPEGTSTDGKRVLPFKTTLFQAFFDERMRGKMWIQPVTVVYTAPKGADPRFYGWWGDMDFGTHLLATLAAPRQGSVEVTYHPPLTVSAYENRKTLAQAAQIAVATAHPDAVTAPRFRAYSS